MDQATDRTLSDIALGESVSFHHVFSKDDIDLFMKISGDYNPLHHDDSYARTTQFEKPIIHGMLINALCSKIVGMHIPGKRSLYLKQTSSFKNPAYVGDILEVTGTVSAKSLSVGLVTLQIIITKENGDVVLDGEAYVKVL